LCRRIKLAIQRENLCGIHALQHSLDSADLAGTRQEHEDVAVLLAQRATDGEHHITLKRINAARKQRQAASKMHGVYGVTAPH
jgi:hypothetical protein